MRNARPKATTLADLTPDPENARRHTDRNLALIAESLDAVGPGRSIVIDEAGRVLAGNATLSQAKAKGLKLQIVDAPADTLVAVRRSGLKAEQKTALALYDNRAAELAEWDPAVLKALAANGQIGSMWTDEELGALFGQEVKAGRTDPDDVPAPRRTSIKPGDLFRLGDHRLLCGDCTDAEQVSRLMGTTKAGLMNTDPPYGIDYQNDSLHPDAGPIRGTVKNDHHRDEALQAFLERAFGCAKNVALADRSAWYLWHAMLTQGFFAAAAAAAAAVVLHRQIIWVKPVLVFGRGQYHWKHELCFFGWVDGQQPPDYGLGAGERTQTTVWEIDSVTRQERKDFNHSTPKPVGLFTIPIIKHLRKGEACYEPFAGSGPQFIAAEQHGRSCYGLELEPSFCQVIIDRWEQFTGSKAVKLDRLPHGAGRPHRPGKGRA